jgi:hypothetical protein
VCTWLQGKVKSKDDFKHLARKLTHLIVEKEQRRMLVKKASSKKGRSGTVTHETTKERTRHTRHTLVD